MLDILKNDKLWVICVVGAIAIICIFKIPEKADTIILAIVSGLFGVAVGQRMGQRTGDQPPAANGGPVQPPK
jgi:hypothetical protein